MGDIATNSSVAARIAASALAIRPARSSRSAAVGAREPISASESSTRVASASKRSRSNVRASPRSVWTTRNTSWRDPSPPRTISAHRSSLRPASSAKPANWCVPPREQEPHRRHLAGAIVLHRFDGVPEAVRLGHVGREQHDALHLVALGNRAELEHQDDLLAVALQVEVGGGELRHVVERRGRRRERELPPLLERAHLDGVGRRAGVEDVPDGAPLNRGRAQEVDGAAGGVALDLAVAPEDDNRLAHVVEGSPRRRSRSAMAAAISLKAWPSRPSSSLATTSTRAARPSWTPRAAAARRASGPRMTRRVSAMRAAAAPTVEQDGEPEDPALRRVVGGALRSEGKVHERRPQVLARGALDDAAGDHAIPDDHRRALGAADLDGRLGVERGEGAAALLDAHGGVDDIRVLPEVGEVSLDGAGVAEVQGRDEGSREEVGDHRRRGLLRRDEALPFALDDSR